MNTIYQNDDTGQVPVSKEMTDAAQDNLVASQNDVAMESPYADLEEWLKEYFGDDFTLGNVESQQRLKEFFFRNMEQNQQLASVLSEDPRLAQLLADIVNGKRNAHAAVARYYGKSFLDFEEGSPEYEEMLQMDEERRKEAFEMARNRHDYENNLEESRPVIEHFCKEHGYEPATFMDNVWEQLVFPILSGRYTPEVCLALDHAISYEKDIEDAFAAGNIKGRNTNIRRMQENFGDGLPKGMNSAAPLQSENSRPKRNSLIDAALNA